jgi:predicted SprT family Zn-dependent metalloprotease
MVEVKDERIIKLESGFEATCKCGATSVFSNKASAVLMLNRGTCKKCKLDIRNTNTDTEILNIYKNVKGKWCSTCSGCGTEQAYTRKDHAKSSSIGDWLCKKCSSSIRNGNSELSDIERSVIRFRKSAADRGIDWEIDVQYLEKLYTGFCALTGWGITTENGRGTASIDRIDSSLGYVEGNVQWVHTMVNMAKNKYNQDKFIEMCYAVAVRLSGRV